MYCENEKGEDEHLGGEACHEQGEKLEGGRTLLYPDGVLGWPEILEAVGVVNTLPSHPQTQGCLAGLQYV